MQDSLNDLWSLMVLLGLVLMLFQIGRHTGRTARSWLIGFAGLSTLPLPFAVLGVLDWLDSSSLNFYRLLFTIAGFLEFTLIAGFLIGRCERIDATRQELHRFQDVSTPLSAEDHADRASRWSGSLLWRRKQ